MATGQEFSGIRDARNIASWIGKRLLIADGSTGTALEAMRLGIGSRAALLPLTDPELLEALHRSYFESGSMFVESATFTANALSLSRFFESGQAFVDADGSPVADPFALAYALNRAGAEAACRAARAAEASSGEPRWVAGSMGPGDAPPSFGSSTWAELRASYLPQARGLADGGADLVIVETCQDPLQIKAALAALMDPEGGRGLPFIVSVTTEPSRRMLTGTGIAALVAIVAPFGPLALGLNCSGGPDELEAGLAELAACSPLPLCFMPNAGLPEQGPSGAVFPFGPELFAAKVAPLIRKYGVAIAGGCCGTTPGHIQALTTALASDGCLDAAFGARPESTVALASLYEVRSLGQDLFLIGAAPDIVDAQKRSGFLADGDIDSLAESALDQEAAGAQALLLRCARAHRDDAAHQNEAADMRELVGALALRARSALFIDANNPGTAAAVLPLTGGRALVGIPFIRDGDATMRAYLSLTREHGSALLFRAAGVDELPLPGVGLRARRCRRFYELATGTYGLPPASLFFDPGLQTTETDPDALAICLEAIAAIKAACPGSPVVLDPQAGLAALPLQERGRAATMLLDLARRRGLDGAIVDCVSLMDPASVDAESKAGILKALGVG